jgi:hypothetical protein
VKGREQVPKVNMRKSNAQKPAEKLDTTKCATINIFDDSHAYKLASLSGAPNGGFTYAYNAVSAEDYDTDRYAHGTRIKEKSLMEPGNFRFQAKVFCQYV